MADDIAPGALGNACTLERLLGDALAEKRALIEAYALVVRERDEARAALVVCEERARLSKIDAEGLFEEMTRAAEKQEEAQVLVGELVEVVSRHLIHMREDHRPLVALLARAKAAIE